MQALYLYLRKNPLGENLCLAPHAFHLHATHISIAYIIWSPNVICGYVPFSTSYQAHINAHILLSCLPFKPLLPLLSGQSYIKDSRPWKSIYCEASSASISFTVLNCSSIPCWTNHLATALALSGFESISWRSSALACCIRST